VKGHGHNQAHASFARKRVQPCIPGIGFACLALNRLGRINPHHQWNEADRFLNLTLNTFATVLALLEQTTSEWGVGCGGLGGVDASNTGKRGAEKRLKLTTSHLNSNSTLNEESSKKNHWNVPQKC